MWAASAARQCVRLRCGHFTRSMSVFESTSFRFSVGLFAVSFVLHQIAALFKSELFVGSLSCLPINQTKTSQQNPVECMSSIILSGEIFFPSTLRILSQSDKSKFILWEGN
jgi:hypothetical protein